MYITLRLLNVPSKSFFVWALIHKYKLAVPNNPPSLIIIRKRIVALFLIWTLQLSTSNLMVITVLLVIVPLLIDPTKEARGNVVHTIISFKFSPSINWIDVIRIIMNAHAINIGRQQLIVRSGLFTFESCQKYIL